MKTNPKTPPLKKSSPARKRPAPLKSYTGSYAFDVPHYFDFTVKARSARHALRLARAALKEGRFSEAPVEACHDNEDNHRVFIQGLTLPYPANTNPDLDNVNFQFCS